ncbi:uncharacterized protein CLUP02_04968 [Colletotrichum lupini]|uniref:Uncharacterized protein n=1 Tax=Colletotrichum lupini TaxID=145971 RepID=A0A9Q8SLU5_9PEZI|nr:uncharacterized protein CLUP02_04968 [Colletotrichum lupini]UQC79488.1 hypothetical protein CLUP02_04968 [Colletotrichum lupini]
MGIGYAMMWFTSLVGLKKVFAERTRLERKTTDGAHNGIPTGDDNDMAYLVKTLQLLDGGVNLKCYEKWPSLLLIGLLPHSNEYSDFLLPDSLICQLSSNFSTSTSASRLLQGHLSPIRERICDNPNFEDHSFTGTFASFCLTPGSQSEYLTNTYLTEHKTAYTSARVYPSLYPRQTDQQQQDPKSSGRQVALKGVQDEGENKKDAALHRFKEHINLGRYSSVLHSVADAEAFLCYSALQEGFELRTW